MQRADRHCNDQGGTSRGEGLKHRNANTFFHLLISGGNVVGGGGGQPLLAGVGTSGVTGEKGTMSKMSVDCGFIEILPACIQSNG